MQQDDRVRAAAELLWTHWQAGTRLAALPPEIRPETRAEGYAIQALLKERSAAPLFGWKIAATSSAGQAHIGVDGPLAGRLLRERVFESGAAILLGTNHMRVAEAEFAFRMGRPLAPRSRPYETDEVLAAVESLHPAVEIPDSRYEDFTIVGAPQLIADDACAHFFVLGPATEAPWRNFDLVEHPVVTTALGANAAPSPAHEGKGRNVLGDPRAALAWLVNELSGLGIALEAGQVVTTGTCIVPIPLAAGDRVRADFGPLGEVVVHIV